MIVVGHRGAPNREVENTGEVFNLTCVKRRSES